MRRHILSHPFIGHSASFETFSFASDEKKAVSIDISELRQLSVTRTSQGCFGRAEMAANGPPKVKNNFCASFKCYYDQKNSLLFFLQILKACLFDTSLAKSSAYLKGLSKYRGTAFLRSVMTTHHLQLVKYWINDISGNIEALILKLGTTNVHHKRNKWHPWCCCHNNSFELVLS